MELLTILCLLLAMPCSLLGEEVLENTSAYHHEVGQDINERFTRIETLLEASLHKNSELEKRIEVLEDDNRRLKASVHALAKERDNGQDLGATLVQEDTSSLLQTGDPAKSPHNKRVVKIPRIILSDEPTVAFTAAVSTRTLSGLGSSQPIVYDRIITNMGGAYHSTTGIFTAPVSGVYVFSFNTMMERGANGYIDLVKNGQWMLGSYIEGKGEHRHDSSSQTGVVDVKQGDEVWVRTGTTAVPSTETVHGNSYSTFSGWLIAISN